MKTENRNEERQPSYRYHLDGCNHCCVGWCCTWWASPAEGNTDGNLALYAMSGKDAQGTPGTGTADNLIMLTMDQGGDINWAAVSVKPSIDGAAL